MEDCEDSVSYEYEDDFESDIEESPAPRQMFSKLISKISTPHIEYTAVRQSPSVSPERVPRVLVERAKRASSPCSRPLNSKAQEKEIMKSSGPSIFNTMNSWKPSATFMNKLKFKTIIQKMDNPQFEGLLSTEETLAKQKQSYLEAQKEKVFYRAFEIVTNKNLSNFMKQQNNKR